MTMTLAFNKCFQVGYSHGDKRRVIEGHYIYYYSQPPQMTSAVICCMFVENCTIISIALPPCCMVVVVKKRHQKVKNSRSTIFLLPFQKVVCSLSFKMCSYSTGKNHCLRCHEEADFWRCILTQEKAEDRCSPWAIKKFLAIYRNLAT